MRCASVTVWGLGLVAALSGAPASAGPWARDAGDVFLSFQISAEDSPSDIMLGLWEPETYTSFYAEAGLGRRMTLGADLGAGEVSQQAVGFLRYTLTPPDATWQWALDGGIGARRIGDGPVHGLVRLGASVGRGFGEGGGGWPMPVRHEGGWIMLDVQSLYDLELQQPIWQAEGTLGFTLSQRSAAIVSLKAEDWPGSDPIVSVSPSFVFDLTPATSVRVGARGALEGSTSVGLFLGLWHEF